ncbi:MAG TPA: hypothetical protein VGF13_17030, partial [Verrucomicrobiae bacterium]
MNALWFNSLACLLLGLAISDAQETWVLRARAASELVKLNDKEFLAGFLPFLTEAARVKPAPLHEDLWLVLRRLETLQSNNTDQITGSLNMSYIVRFMARDGSRADFQQLLDFADKLPAEGFHRRYVMNALLDFAIRLEVEALGDRRIDVKLPGNAPRLAPSAIPAATPALTNAAKLFDSVRALHPPEPTNAWLSAQANWGFFYDTIGQLLRGKLTNASQQMLQFKWGGWCGTGADMLQMPQSRTLFVALLQERQYGAALGALPNVKNEGFMSLSMFGDELAWKRGFISKCALDWEALYAGEMLNYYSGYNADAAHALARFGSEKGARLLADMATVPSIANGRDYLHSIGALIVPSEKGPNASGTIVLSTYSFQWQQGRSVSNALPAGLQLEFLHILHGKLREPNVSLELAGTVVGILAELHRPESIAALREAMSLPYDKVRQTAASALKDLGERIQAPAPLPPVAFRIVANGKPFANAHVQYELAMTGGHASSSARETDSNGTLL